MSVAPANSRTATVQVHDDARRDTTYPCRCTGERLHSLRQAQPQRTSQQQAFILVVYATQIGLHRHIGILDTQLGPK
eukprot:133303-Pleurochrysis_carterae.AAC.1